MSQKHVVFQPIIAVELMGIVLYTKSKVAKIQNLLDNHFFLLHVGPLGVRKINQTVERGQKTSCRRRGGSLEKQLVAEKLRQLFGVLKAACLC